MRTFVCRDRVPDPAPHINPPSVIDECCHTSTSSFSFFLVLSLTHSPTTNAAATTLSSCSGLLVFLFLFLHCVCVYICKVCIAVMNLGKWMSWRKRNFFRRKGKHESSLDLGKLVLINLKSRLNTPALILFFIAEGA